MATTTTNFGFDVPTSSDLVKNGATQIALLGQDIDTFLYGSPTRSAGKNRIINGAMTIDQRNSGAAVTINSSTATYVLDRFVNFGQPTDGVYTVQRDTTAPSGFSNSLKATVTTADASIGSTQFYLVQQYIEGYNVADFAYGTAAAKTVTLSFWVRSSVTGTFGGSFRNSAQDRSYPFSYAINTANTWEQKSVVVAGDTTGTWDNTTGRGLSVIWSLGDGSSRLGTAGAWAAGSLTGVTGQTNLIATASATWYITGVQVEIGSVATAFSNAGGNIQGELAACQRYYWRTTATTQYQPMGSIGLGVSTNLIDYYFTYPTTMRIKPTSLDYSSPRFYDPVSTTVYSGGTVVLQEASANVAQLRYTNGTSNITIGRGILSLNDSATGYYGFSAEL